MNGYVKIITGLLGGGKSYFASVIRGYEHLKAGGFLYTNVEMYPDVIAECMERDGKVFDPERLVLLDGKCVKGFESQIKRGTPDMPVMVVLDEAHLEWNSRDYQQTRKDPAQKKMLTLNTLARKLDLALYYITQNYSDVDKQIRGKASGLITCRNLFRKPLIGFIRIPYPIFLFNFYEFNESHGKPFKVDWDLKILDKRKCRMYNSDALLGEDAKDFEGMQIAYAKPLADAPKPKPNPWFRWAQYTTSFVSCLIFYV